MYKVKTLQKIILVRINGLGTEELIDREREFQHMKLLSDFEVGAKVFCTFDNGFVYDFIPGRNLEPKEMAQFCEKIAVKMVQFHQIEKHGDKKESNILRMVHKWMETAIDLVEAGGENLDQDTCQRIRDMNVPKMKKELDCITELLKQYECELAFCHNDLQPLNIIYDDSSDTIHFIDYEYCGYNYRCFDIGNHFSEYTGYESMSYALYPSIEVQRRFIKAYLKELKKTEPTEKMIEKMRIESNFLSLLATLSWGTWAIPQAKNSNIEFDYLDYGKKKYELYWETRDQFIKEFIEYNEQNK